MGQDGRDLFSSSVVPRMRRAEAATRRRVDDALCAAAAASAKTIRPFTTASPRAYAAR